MPTNDHPAGIEAEIQRRAEELAEQKLEEERARKEREQEKIERERLRASVQELKSMLQTIESRLANLEDFQEGLTGLETRLRTLEDDNAVQQGAIDTLAKGYSQVASSVEQVEEGQLTAPARARLGIYSVAAGGGAVGVVEVIKGIAALFGG